jgi:hypothetical protein
MENKWIPVKNKNPRGRIKVLVFFINQWGKKRITIAEFVSYRTIYAENFLHDDCVDNLDLVDIDDSEVAWVKEGWYEYQEETEMDFKIAGKITHWMSLPEFPN